MTTYTGHCHCGQTEWTVKLDDDPSHVLCHCDACKLLSGGESTLNAIVPKSHFQLTKGELKTYTYQGDSGNQVHCYFCPTCTSSPYHHQTVLGADKYVVRTGLLRGGKAFTVGLEIFGKDRLGWVPEVARTVEGPPE